MPPSPNKTRSAGKRRLIAAAAAGIAVVLAGLLVLYRQPVTDWWRLRGYQPPAAIRQLADQDTMTAYTRHLFYLNRPQLLSSVDSFRQHCPENKDTTVLGCYHPDQAGIYIYDVKDPDLKGVSQVTAAHEVLHAIYARLSSADRQSLNKQLQDYYQHGLTDQRVKDEIKLYQKTEPHDVLDEMSCTFGTEIADLPAPLDAYYQRYFADRSVIIAYEKQYEGAFTTRQSQIKQDDRQLATMKRQIDSREAALRTQQDQLSAMRSQLKALLDAGRTGEYNARIPAYNAQVNGYNSGVAGLKALISQYNQLVAARNAIASELTTLDKALDTRLTPASQGTH